MNLKDDDLADASLDSQPISLEPILAAFAPDEEPALSGQAEIHLTLHGPLKDARQLKVHVKLPVLKLAYNNTVQLGASPVQADLQNGIVTLQPTTIRGTDTELNVQGSFPVGTQAPASLKAHGTVNLQIVQIFDPDLRASGQLKVNVESHGAIGSGLVAGEIEVAAANLSTTASPVGLQNANCVLKLSNDRLEIGQFSGTVGGGQVTAQGAIVFRPRIQFDLGATAKGAKLLYPQGVREAADANLRLTGTIHHALLSGSVNLSDMSFTPAFDLSTTVNQFAGGVEAPSTQGFAQYLYLNIALNSSNNVNLVSRTLSVGGSANLQVRGTAAEPVVLGRVNLLERGHHFERKQVRLDRRHHSIHQSRHDTTGSKCFVDHDDSGVQDRFAISGSVGSITHPVHLGPIPAAGQTSSTCWLSARPPKPAR